MFVKSVSVAVLCILRKRRLLNCHKHHIAILLYRFQFCLLKFSSRCLLYLLPLCYNSTTLKFLLKISSKFI